MTATGWLAVAVFAVAYVLIATERIHRVAAALGGAVLMLLLGATDAEHAFFSEEAGIDWNVLFLLAGMMLIVAVLQRTGVFEYVAIWAAKRARGRPFRVMVILVLVTAVASAVLDNVTTVLLIAPVTFLVCERLAVPVAPFLIAEALASNIGGTATLVGDPPNIIIASRAGLSYNDFLVHLAPLVLVLLVVFIGLCRWLFRAAFTLRRRAGRRSNGAAGTRRHPRPAPADREPGRAHRGHRRVRAAQPAAPGPLGRGVGRRPGAAGRLPPGRRTGRPGRRVAHPGVLRRAVRHGRRPGQHRRHRPTRPRGRATSPKAGSCSPPWCCLWISAVLSAIVDNIPYVATMTPVVAELVHNAGDTGQSMVLWWALALGADLGGNATAVGASANVVVLGIAERSGRPITFWEFTKYGLIVAAVTVGIAMPYLWLRYFVLTG